MATQLHHESMRHESECNTILLATNPPYRVSSLLLSQTQDIYTKIIFNFQRRLVELRDNELFTLLQTNN